MASRNTSLVAMIGMMFVVLGISLIIPAVFINTENPNTTSFIINEGEREGLTGHVSAFVRDVTFSGSNRNANLTVINEQNGLSAATGEMQIGETRNLTLQNETIEVTLRDVTDTDTTIYTFTYPLYLSWPSGSSVIVDYAPEFILLSGIILITGVIMAAIGGFD